MDESHSLLLSKRISRVLIRESVPWYCLLQQVCGRKHQLASIGSGLLYQTVCASKSISDEMGMDSSEIEWNGAR